MLLAARVFIGLVAALHAYFLVLEMFLWEKPLGLKIFRQSAEKARLTAVLAKNQGLYNGFLTAGLLWGLYLNCTNVPHGTDVIAFFLGCVIVAGVYGAATVSRGILFVQAIPAIIALGLLLAA